MFGSWFPNAKAFVTLLQTMSGTLGYGNFSFNILEQLDGERNKRLIDSVETPLQPLKYKWVKTFYFWYNG